VNAQQLKNGAQIDIPQHAGSTAHRLRSDSVFNVGGRQSARHATVLVAEWSEYRSTFKKSLTKYLQHRIRNGGGDASLLFSRAQPGREEIARTQASSASLTRELRLGDLVLLQALLIVGLPWIGYAAKAGGAHVILWLLRRAERG
jgi:hypothetical protein